MPLLKHKKKEVIENFKTHAKDTGSSVVQIAILSERINSLEGHFKTNTKDYHSRRGLLIMIGKRRKLLTYLKKHDAQKYQETLTKLKLRK